MSLAFPAVESARGGAGAARGGVAGAGSVRAGAAADGSTAPVPYLRSYRAQPRRRVSFRAVALLLLAASLLFLKVWERTVANSLSMERDRLAHEVRTLENRIRISRDLKEQAVFKSGIDPAALNELGFRNPDPERVVDIDLSNMPSSTRSRGWAERAKAMLRPFLPPRVTERVAGLPAAPVEAQRVR